MTADLFKEKQTAVICFIGTLHVPSCIPFAFLFLFAYQLLPPFSVLWVKTSFFIVGSGNYGNYSLYLEPMNLKTFLNILL